jgi:glycolate oxidase iron-sulfur subunit
MQTSLAPEFANTPEGLDAQAIIGNCVHCGFCTATCPTYQLLGDELDGPRGRIYLIKEMLEGKAPTRKTQLHLDRCLTCRNCETTCPSGVQYGNLLEIGRSIVERKVERPLGEKLLRSALKNGLTSPLFKPAMAVGKALRPLLPAVLKNKVPAARSAGVWPSRTHERRVLMLAGCVQPGMMPNINAATARVLDAVAVQTLVAPKAGCCGAIKLHLNDHAGGLADIRRNIDAWWPLVEGEGAVEAIVMNASGCGVTVKEYGHALHSDPQYAAKAARISELCVDISQYLAGFEQQLKPLINPAKAPTLAFHPPCTLQHGQQLKSPGGPVETLLTALGFNVKLARSESHLCCGSAGTYSVTQPVLSYQLRDRKLAQLVQLDAERITSANVGCIAHLQTGTETPVEHWIETLDSAIRG